MGWFWSKSADGSASASQASSSTSQPDAATSTPSQPSQAPSTTDSPQNSAQANDGSPENDPELRKFMAMFEKGEIGLEDPRKAAAGSSSSKSDEASKWSQWKDTWSSKSAGDATAGGDDDFEPRERSLGEAVLPVSMSCRQAFDLAWACQSPAGQWRAVYRHGGVRPCSDLWDDFWFCMRVKGYAEGPMKEEAIRSYYRKKEIDKYYRPGQPSSEDVWRSRTVDEVLAPGEVFQHDFKVALNGGSEQSLQRESKVDDNGREDANKILADAERRKNIRDGLGYNK